MAILYSIALLNLRQAQIEKTQNLNMSCQCVLSKMPKHNLNKLPPLESSAMTESFSINQNNNSEYTTYLRTVLDLEDYEFLLKVSAEVSDRIDKADKQ